LARAWYLTLTERQAILRSPRRCCTMAQARSLGAVLWLCLAQAPHVAASAATVEAHSALPPLGPQPDVAIGARMEISMPLLNWVPCTVLSTGVRPGLYNVQVDGLPKPVELLNDIPAAALRPPLPRDAANLRGAADSKAKGALAAVGQALLRNQEQQFDCTKHPGLCQSPFNCQNFTNREHLAWYWHGIAHDGVSNPRAWCQTPEESAYVTECVAKGNLAAAVQTRYERSRYYGETTHELEASRCFIEGHCKDKNVTWRTSVLEGSRLCDARYGRERWSDYGTFRAAEADMPGAGGASGGTDGYRGKHQTTPLTLRSCAAGRFHCDVMFCRETYCKIPYYVDRYSHFLQD